MRGEEEKDPHGKRGMKMHTKRIGTKAFNVKFETSRGGINLFVYANDTCVAVQSSLLLDEITVTRDGREICFFIRGMSIWVKSRYCQEL